ncbi:hypothetical protein C9422_17305 [Pseudomonas sp. B1(2018)]|nr:hypothetical protein C9422_17305 [Pseudomonas sp. B1(2018)]
MHLLINAAPTLKKPAGFELSFNVYSTNLNHWSIVYFTFIYCFKISITDSWYKERISTDSINSKNSPSQIYVTHWKSII